jgi:diaminopimelate epimerase
MISYYKLSGGGNDFIALVEPEAEPSSLQIRSWCRRGLSLGADGLFVLRREGASAARMHYYNADGVRADLCVNAARCAVRLAGHLEWTSGSIDLETGAGRLHGCTLDPTRVAIELPVPATPEPLSLEVEERTWTGWKGVVGVPHFALVWEGDLGTAPVTTIGSLLRSHPAHGTAGANVNFVQFPSLHDLEIRTYERGVEAETLACGTGVISAVAVGLAVGALDLPVGALTLGGFRFEVSSGESNGISHWTLTGDARLLSEGSLQPGALHLPSSPGWA